MASNWLQKWWWKIQPPSPGIPFEQGVVEPYLEFQTVLARAQHDIDVQSLAKKNKQQEKTALYAHYAKQVIAYDQRSWLSQSWVWLTDKRPAIDRKRLWCAAYRCQSLQDQVIPLAKMPAFPPRIITPEKIDSIRKLMQPSSEHPALPTSWLAAIKNVVQGWAAFYKPNKPASEKKTTSITQSTNVNESQSNPPAIVGVSPDQAASLSFTQQREDVFAFATACGFLRLDPLKLQGAHVDTLKAALKDLRRDTKILAKKNKRNIHSYQAFLKQAEIYYVCAKRLLPKVALISPVQYQAYNNDELFITHFRDGVTLRACTLHPLYASPVVGNHRVNTNAKDNRQNPVPMNMTPPVHTTALVLSAIPALAQEDPKNYKMLVSNFISACGFYGLDVLQATPRQVASCLRRSIVALHTDRAEKAAIGSEGKIVAYSKDAQVNYHAHRTEQLTELKTRFDIAGLPPEQLLLPNALISVEETFAMYKVGQQFRYELEQSVKTSKVMVCLHSEVDIHGQDVKDTALELAAYKEEFVAWKAEFEGQLAQAAEAAAKENEQTKAEFKAQLAQAAEAAKATEAKFAQQAAEAREQTKAESEAQFQRIVAMVASGKLTVTPASAPRVSDTVSQRSFSPGLFQPAPVQAEATLAPSPVYLH